MDRISEEEELNRTKSDLEQTQAILLSLINIERTERQPEMHEAIQKLLQQIGEYSHADRTFIFDKSGDVYCNAAEWCANDVTPQIDNLQDIASRDMPYWIEKFEKLESVIIPDLEAVKEIMPAEYEILKAQDIHSEIAAPIYYKTQLSGFIGIDNPADQPQLFLQLLQLVGGHLGSMREHHHMLELLEQKQHTLEKSLQELEREQQVLSVLASDYTSVFRIDLIRNTAEIVKIKSFANALEANPNKHAETQNYTAFVHSYAEHFLTGENRKKFLERFESVTLMAALRSAESVQYRFQSIPNGAGQEYFEVKITRIYEDALSFTAIVGFRHIDNLVHEERKHQKELEAALEAETLNNQIISGISKIYSSIYRIDLAKDYYEEVSSDTKFHRLTGRAGKASEKLYELCNRLVASEYKARVQRFFDLSTLPKRMHSEDTIAFEYLAEDGNWHLARFIATKWDEAGNVTQVLYVTTLISDQKRREQYWILIAEEANKANAAKSEFLSRMSHDIRTPMNAIMGLISIAKHHPDDLAKLQDCLEKIGSAGQTLQQLVNDVLDFNQIESGKLKIRPQETRLSEICGSIMETLGGAAENKKLTFTYEPQDITYDTIVADPLRLNQVYTNLLSNAIKYTPEGGKVRFAVKETVLPEKKVRLTAVIEDTGIGMSEDFMKEMYTEFARAVDTRVNKERGSGLGLAIVKQIVDLMHGRIQAESKLGHGTKFTVTVDVPYLENHEAEHDAAADRNSCMQCEGKHILMAEDNDLNYEIAAELLEAHGIRSTRAENGAVCVEKFQKSKPGTYDAILMDMQMPVMDGPEAAKAIRALARPDAQTIPILAVTANAYHEDIEKCLAAGMNAHLSKPLDIHQIIQTMRKFWK